MIRRGLTDDRFEACRSRIEIPRGLSIYPSLRIVGNCKIALAVFGSESCLKFAVLLEESLPTYEVPWYLGWAGE